MGSLYDRLHHRIYQQMLRVLNCKPTASCTKCCMQSGLTDHVYDHANTRWATRREKALRLRNEVHGNAELNFRIEVQCRADLKFKGSTV